MPRHPSFFLLGSMAGLVIWLIEAPPPFPFLGMTAMISGALGLALSIVYLKTFAPWQWRMKLVALRRAGRALLRAFTPAPKRASEFPALRATS